ncbi:prepilin peptidase [Halalkalibacter krulwichiae]|uniref:Type IV leader peptidase family protein n=1 Tax=Halalkalibacter krulwichiae TaxID=199441 RepID=A0A1X9MIB7_9BACI|nr:prepilin peptidase [Halalkalibacter krulwichiae]ARK31993.1 Type IV leader peptidase family protein [Halalkalibacter krulwichiae]
MFLYIITSAFLLLAVIIDIRTRRIPNPLALSLLIISIISHSITVGAGVFEYLLSSIITLFVFFIMYVIRFLGAGDVKLITAAAATFTFPATYTFWFLILGIGCLFSIIHVIKARGIRSVLFLSVTPFQTAKRMITSKEEDEPLSFPFSIVIAFSWMVTIYV